MEIILAKSCKSLAGRLNRSHGYYIREIKGHFFGQRCKNNRWADGHLNFILDLAGMAGGIIVADIKVQPCELRAALEEAHCFVAAGHVHDRMVYDARDIRNFKTTFGL